MQKKERANMRMTISKWLSKKGTPISQLRKRQISESEWRLICEEFEQYCFMHNQEPDYEVFSESKDH